MRSTVSVITAVIAVFIAIWAALAIAASLVTGSVIVWPWGGLL